MIMQEERKVESIIDKAKQSITIRRAWYATFNIIILC